MAAYATTKLLTEFEGLLKEARATAKRSKANQSDVKAAIKKARKA
jgi:hypothetical protein